MIIKVFARDFKDNKIPPIGAKGKMKTFMGQTNVPVTITEDHGNSAFATLDIDILAS